MPHRSPRHASDSQYASTVAFVDAIKKLDIALQTGVFPLDHPLAILSSGERGLEEGKYHLARSTWQEDTNRNERYVLREQRRSATRAFFGFGFGHFWPGPGPIIIEASTQEALVAWAQARPRASGGRLALYH